MQSTDTHGRKILAIDDSSLNLKLLYSILTKEGFEVFTTLNSLEALPLAIQHNPDLILLDIMMPGLSGLEVLKLLKQNSLTHTMSVLMVTARTKAEDVRDALETGAFDYVKKPLEEVEIVARVHSALRYKIYQDRLLAMAMRDSLTGLYNHGLLIELLGKELYNARRKEQSVTFAMMDIDHFKRINDQYGHQAGDMILQEVAGLLTKGLRKGDAIGRYGGEEFGFILTGVELDQAVLLSDRIRQTIQETTFTYEGQKISITVSFGLSVTFPDRQDAPNELIRRADAALYRAKETGRNRLVVAENNP
jgi:diguanylate cyclase (GGDEF)-like protein